MSVWSFLFNSDKRFEPNTAESAQWNRGAYLAKGLAHCGECHTPRNLMQALNNRPAAPPRQAGAPTTSQVIATAAWAPGATPNSRNICRSVMWTVAERPRDPWAEAVDHSLSYLTKGDIAALVTYLRSVPPSRHHIFRC